MKSLLKEDEQDHCGSAISEADQQEAFNKSAGIWASMDG
jgi:hypothetical protein